jgi:cytochrome c peroxidase
MIRNFVSFIIFVLIFSGIWGCKNQDNDLLKIESLFGEVPFPDKNPLTKNGVILGEKLFFDPLLSANYKVSCATCHLPERSFSDGEKLSSNGVSGNSLFRNSPALINLAWNHTGLFWDGGAKDLESLIFGPLTHQDEMAKDLKVLVQELNDLDSYRKMFYAVFKKDSITSVFIARALAQYVRTLIFQDSKYDAVVAGRDTFSILEAKGQEVFEKNCSICHSSPFFTDFGFHNNGLDDEFGNDENEGVFKGRYRITLKKYDLGKYKTPTLRNIALTSPYMHDGRFETLEEVINHYSENVKISVSLDSKLAPDPLNPGFKFTKLEKEALIAFLNSLTDNDFLY